MLEIKKHMLTKEFTYQNTVILTYKIQYLEVVSSSSSSGITKFNFVQEKQARILCTIC